MSGNKRVSQLTALTAAEVVSSDLFLIVDTSAKESKKIAASDLSAYLNASGSLTAIHSVTSDTASYIQGSKVDGSVFSASYAVSASNSISSSYSKQSSTASFAITASFAQNVGTAGNSSTSSFLLYAGFPNGTASFALTSSKSTTSLTSSFLIYTGVPNGTSSYAIKTGLVDLATHALTASMLAGSGPTSLSASYALFAENSNVSQNSTSASFLVFSPNNGTASYAVVAGGVANILNDFGIFLANTQSLILAQLDAVDLTPSLGTPQVSYIEAWGTVIVPYTSSVPTNGTLFLAALDRNSGTTYQLDSTPIVVNISPTMGVWDNFDSGTIKMVYSLVGQNTLSASSYQVYVSASSNISLESTRTTRFNVNSYSDIVGSHPSESINFALDPSASATITFTSTAGGPFQDKLTGFNTTASANILTLNVDSQSLSSIRYVWKLSSLTRLDCSTNPLLQGLSGMPSSLSFLSASNCALTSIRSLNNITSMSYIDVSGNSLTSLPSLPVTLSWLNCSNNFINPLPSSLPYGMSVLYAQNNSLTTTPTSFPNSITTMSLANNTSLALFAATQFPLSLSYFSCNNDPVVSLPLPPTLMRQMFVSNCSLISSTMDDITTTLVSNAQTSGTLDLTGNGIPSATAISNIATLQTASGWIVLYDTM
jgi:hypothetical protein